MRILLVAALLLLPAAHAKEVLPSLYFQAGVAAWDAVAGAANATAVARHETMAETDPLAAAILLGAELGPDDVPAEAVLASTTGTHNTLVNLSGSGTLDVLTGATHALLLARAADRLTLEEDQPGIGLALAAWAAAVAGNATAIANGGQLDEGRAFAELARWGGQHQDPDAPNLILDITVWAERTHLGAVRAGPGWLARQLQDAQAGGAPIGDLAGAVGASATLLAASAQAPMGAAAATTAVLGAALVLVVAWSRRSRPEAPTPP